MADWKVVDSLDNLLDEIDEVAPNRDRASDGSIGDTSHGARPSGHNPDETGVPEDHDADGVNEVRARDFDVDLRRPGLTMEMICQYLLSECRAGRITWIKYIIFNRRIWSASGDWVTRPYTGANPHDKHMHVSSKPDTDSERNVKRIGLARLVKEPEVELNDVVGNSAYPQRTVRQFINDEWGVRDILVGDPKRGGVPAGSPLADLIRVGDQWASTVAKIDALTTAMAAERAEVPPTAEAVALRVTQLIEDMPEVIVNISPEDLKTAIVAAVHEITTPGG